jgi:outer membrane lipoprotein-sorting protein
MTEFDNLESEFKRLLQGLPFDDAARLEQRERLREQVLAKFDQARSAERHCPWWQYAFMKGRDIMRRPIPRMLAAGACVTAIALWLLLPGQQSTAVAFHRFAEAIIQAKTAKFDMEVAVEGQPKKTFKTWFNAPTQYRQEVDNIVNVSDLAAGKIVTVIPAEKKVMLINIKGTLKEKARDNYFEQMRRLFADERNADEKKFENLGEKMIDGKKALGFRLVSPMGKVTLWGDPQSSFPVRIENDYSGLPATRVVMTNFQINPELKPALFDMTPPAGYKVQSLDVDGSEPREEDVVQGFKACTEISGDFPDSLDTAGISKLIINYTVSQLKKDGAKQPNDEQMQKLMNVSIKIGRGFQFMVQLPPASEATYAGKGVKFGAKDTPIFWYKPAGSARYRVLDAELIMHDRESAPQVAGAQRITKRNAE